MNTCIALEESTFPFRFLPFQGPTAGTSGKRGGVLKTFFLVQLFIPCRQPALLHAWVHVAYLGSAWIMHTHTHEKKLAVVELRGDQGGGNREVRETSSTQLPQVMLTPPPRAAAYSAVRRKLPR